MSRLRESRRNDKVWGFCLGRVYASPMASGLATGTVVVAFVPIASRAAHAVVVRPSCVEVAIATESPRDAQDEASQAVLDSIRSFAGWSRYSGAELDASRVRRALGVFRKVREQDLRLREGLTPSHFTSEIASVEPAGRPQDDAPTAVLFGLGNYAKSVMLPVLSRTLDLRRVHEIDPDQARYLLRSQRVTVDTAPSPRGAYHYDAWVIAGFHHTHAPLAVEAIRSGAYAIVEKPLATSLSELQAVRSELQKLPASKLFLCFQRRYSVIHKWVQSDFRLEHGDAIDMHAIVYEIPLPSRHWYNWPNSRSRMISNGCHWVDYFLFVNGYPAVADFSIWPGRGSDLFCFLKLANGAFFSMALTESGSSRLGVRDHIELRGKGMTGVISDASFYKSETKSRVLTSRSANPMEAYRTMYRTIAVKVRDRAAGDEISTLGSTEAAIILDEMLASASGRASKRQ